MKGEKVIVRGQVQGVGFRPTVWRIATELGLSGQVLNTGRGVEIRLWGELRDEFLERLVQELPPLAHIDALERMPLARCEWDGDEERGRPGFDILPSEGGEVTLSITPDSATCTDCLEEIRNPLERRYRYPFTNCTNCGPRATIMTGAPYDRHQTTMASFPLCSACRADYENPGDRRFHAQPVACHACGPKAFFKKLGAGSVEVDAFSGLDDVEAAGKALEQGFIIALKGLGGVHLTCDACNEDVVARLRRGKQRAAKPFALMARDKDVIRHYAELSEQEEALLSSSEAPIVLLRPAGDKLPDSIAPGLNQLGFMLPYTPLHHMLLSQMTHPVVMTSGNLSHYPQCLTNEEVERDLSSVADFALLHDRAIAHRMDDSVARVVGGRARIMRRGRGYAPAAIDLPVGFSDQPKVLALGGELKNTFCLIKEGRAIVSQHMGDLENIATYEEAGKSLRLFEDFYGADVDVIAVDTHPDYLSTKRGVALADVRGCPVLEIQHHHAHIASCLVDNNYPLTGAPVLGIVMDGLGYGQDGTLWGGEFLLADYTGFSRLGCLKPVALPGGDAAVRTPWRNAYAHLMAGMGWDELSMAFSDLPLFTRLERLPRQTLDAMIERGVQTPLSSSCGRLFDAAAAIVGLAWERQDYEGEAAMLFEAALDETALDEPQTAIYPFTIAELPGQGLPYIEPLGVWRAMLADKRALIPLGTISARFHRGLARAIALLAMRLVKRHTISHIALSGGCFQNRMLFRLVHSFLLNKDVTILDHAAIPTNDGGLSLGQAAIALALQQRGGCHVSWHTGSNC